MIAAQRAVAPPRHVERVRTATKRRTRRTKRRMHAPVLAVMTLAVVLLLPLLGYVTLTSNLTALNYALARGERQRTALIEESQRLDDKIARLHSPERLAALAASLRLRDPHVYAVVRVPEPQVAAQRPRGAFFAWLAAR